MISLREIIDYIYKSFKNAPGEFRQQMFWRTLVFIRIIFLNNKYLSD